MKNFAKNLVINLFMAAVISAVICGTLFPDVPPVFVAVGIVVFYAILELLGKALGGFTESSATFMAIQKELWTDSVIKNLFRGNEFLNYCFREDQYVLAGKVVHVPVAGGKPTVVKNRSSLPATSVLRTDTDVTYALDEYTTDPITIPDAEKIELSYDKVDDILSDHQQALNETVGDDILIKWCKTGSMSAYVIRTTGAAIAAHMDSATGNRKKFMKEELKAAQTYMNKKNIPKNDRYAVFSSEMMSQLMDDDDLKKRDFGKELNLPEGSIGRLYDFWLIDRSYTVTYDNQGTPVVKALGAASAATDNDAVICFHKNSVTAAIGEVKFFENKDNPLYYGDVYSALVRAGGRLRRSEGVVAIVQAASA